MYTSLGSRDEQAILRVHLGDVLPYLGEFERQKNADVHEKSREQPCLRRKSSRQNSASRAGIFLTPPWSPRAAASSSISGMTARRADGSIAGVGDIEAQTRQVCENVKAAVEQAGGTMDDICRVDVYVRNMEHFDLIHKVRREYFQAPAPASTMVEVTKMTSPDYLIEINAIAVIGE